MRPQVQRFMILGIGKGSKYMYMKLARELIENFWIVTFNLHIFILALIVKFWLGESVIFLLDKSINSC